MFYSWSHISNFDEWNPPKSIELPDNLTAMDLIGAEEYKGAFCIFTENAVYRLEGDLDKPETLSWQKINCV